MKLADWLSAKNMTRTAFAMRIGVSPSLITLLCNGTSWPGRRVAEAIFRETEGAVTAHDFLTELPDEGRLGAAPCPCI